MSVIVRVAAAVILRPDGAVLLAQRPAGKAYAGYWEFPGGKLEADETPAHAHVELNFFRVYAFDGEPASHDGQAFAWQDPHAIAVSPLLPANTRVLAALTLPTVYAITCASDMGADAFVERAKRAIANGVRLVQVREPETGLRDVLARRLVPAFARVNGQVLVNGSADDARRLGCAGVHWTAQTLLGATARPRDLVVGASCHTRAEIAHAGALDVDFAVLGPVLATPTHPDARPLGWTGFVAAIEGTRVPVFALGGMHISDLDTAIAHGAHGVAMRRYAWTDS